MQAVKRRGIRLGRQRNLGAERREASGRAMAHEALRPYGTCASIRGYLSSIKRAVYRAGESAQSLLLQD
jgi:hypothetical protein